MTAATQTGTPEEGFTAVCVHCKRISAGAVVVGSIERASGPPLVQYACPDCAPKHGAEPTPYDVIH
ncbi:hypothetical protein ABZ714_21290 [Streptomyces sp. NPDC006798]|uniref:hypothetical protein n=1 Tax=Streptomyces sp. NPDC006798 TaxID=3155462 RepID=UPI0033C832A6